MIVYDRSTQSDVSYDDLHHYCLVHAAGVNSTCLGTLTDQPYAKWQVLQEWCTKIQELQRPESRDRTDDTAVTSFTGSERALLLRPLRNRVRHNDSVEGNEDEIAQSVCSEYCKSEQTRVTPSWFCPLIVNKCPIARSTGMPHSPIANSYQVHEKQLENGAVVCWWTYWMIIRITTFQPVFN